MNKIDDTFYELVCKKSLDKRMNKWTSSSKTNKTKIQNKNISRVFANLEKSANFANFERPWF